jgi:hypothetical protein
MKFLKNNAQLLIPAVAFIASIAIATQHTMFTTSFTDVLIIVTWGTIASAPIFILVMILNQKNKEQKEQNKIRLYDTYFTIGKLKRVNYDQIINIDLRRRAPLRIGEEEIQNEPTWEPVIKISYTENNQIQTAVFIPQYNHKYDEFIIPKPEAKKFFVQNKNKCTEMLNKFINEEEIELKSLNYINKIPLFDVNATGMVKFV